MRVSRKLITFFSKCPFKLIMILLSLLTVSSASAQTHYDANVAIGAKAGMDFSRVFFTPHVTQSFNIGYTGGIMVRYVEENHFGIIGELGFAQRGWKENFEGAPYNYARTTDYAELAALAHVFFGRRARFFFNAGPQVGLFLGEKTKANFNPDEMKTLPDFPNVNRINEQMLLPVSHKIDYGISAAAGVEFNFTKRNSIFVECRFYFGLSNIMPSQRADYFNGSNQMSLSATIGYWFRVK